MFDINSILSAAIFFCCIPACLSFVICSVQCIVELTVFPDPHCNLYDSPLGAAIRMLGVPVIITLIYAVTAASFILPLLYANLLMSLLNILLSIYVLRLRAGEHRKWSPHDQTKYGVYLLYCIVYPLIVLLFSIGILICLNH